MQAPTIESEQIPGFYRDPHVQEVCRPFAMIKDRSEAVVFIHGLTGSPADFRDYVLPYADRDFDVYVPLLPGHGSHISMLQRLTYRELFIPLPALMAFLKDRYQRIHLTAFSYGAVLGADLALQSEVATLSFFAPAFFLSTDREKSLTWVKRLKMHRFQGRIAKKRTGSRVTGMKDEDHTYDSVPLLATVELHEQASRVRERLTGWPGPVFHAHGDRDPTTPMTPNHELLKEMFANYRFYRVEGAAHVLSLEPGNRELAEAHLAWLKGQP